MGGGGVWGGGAAVLDGVLRYSVALSPVGRIVCCWVEVFRSAACCCLSA